MNDGQPRSELQRQNRPPTLERRELSGPLSSAQRTWRIAFHSSCDVSSICTPVQTGHVASCNTLRRDGPQEETPERSSPMGRHHDQVGLVRFDC